MNPALRPAPGMIYLQEAVSTRTRATWLPWLLLFIVGTWLISFVFDFYLSLAILSYVALAAALVGLFYPTIGSRAAGRLITVSEASDERLADYVRLRDASLRRYLKSEHGLFIAEGEKVIRRAVEAGYRAVVPAAQRRPRSAGRTGALAPTS